MMKKFAFLLLFLLPLVSCVNRQGADQVESIKDSLTRVVAAKDSMINEVFASMNAVAENLNAIKVREKIINKNIDNGEIRNQTPTQINEDVEAINQLLLQNRETIARLQQSANQLKKANINSANMEKLIAQLRQQVETKDQEIVMLKNNLEQMHVQVAELHEQVSGLNTQGDRAFPRRRPRSKARSRGRPIFSTPLTTSSVRRKNCSPRRLSTKAVLSADAEDQREPEPRQLYESRYPSFRQRSVGQKKVTLVSSHPAGFV